MRPRYRALPFPRNKIAEERPALERRGVARGAGVHQVGAFAFHHLAMLIPDREPPDFFAGPLAGGRQLGHEIVVVAHHAGHRFAQGDDHAARERREVHDRGRFVRLDAPGESVAQDQPAFGISVGDIDGDAVVHVENVAGTVRRGAEDILGAGENADQAHRQLQHRHGVHQSEHGHPARLVVNHSAHLLGGFDRDAAGVERDRLADYQQRTIFLCLGAAIFQHDHSRRGVGATRANPQDSPHSQPVHLLLVQDAATQLRLRRQILRHFRQ